MQAHLPRALRSFGLNVRKRREAKGLTQERAGQKANLEPDRLKRSRLKFAKGKGVAGEGCRRTSHRTWEVTGMNGGR